MLKKIIKNKGGFTLVELTVVLAIIGIIMAIATPKLNTVRRMAAITAHHANVKTLTTAATMYISDNGVPATDLEWNEKNTDSWKDYLQEWPEIPKGLSSKDFKDGEDITDYKVTIKPDGTVIVQPDEITN